MLERFHLRRLETLRVPISMRGTLVVVIPTNAGIVFAADSRSTLGEGLYLDTTEKLKVPEGRNDIAFAVTGTGTWKVPPPSPEIDLRSWMQVAPVEFQAHDHVARFLGESADLQLDEALLQTLGSHLASLLDFYFSNRSGAVDQHLGRELLRLVVANYSYESLESRIGTLLIRVSAEGKPVPEGHSLWRVPADDERVIAKYGESEYVDTHVLKGRGRAFLPQTFADLWNGAEKIADMTPDRAALIATGLIHATERTSEQIPIRTGVGGRPRVMLIDGIRQPTDLSPDDKPS